MKLGDVLKFLNEGETDLSYYMEEGCGIYAMALSQVKPGGQIYIMSNKDGEVWSKSIPFEVTHVVYNVDGKSYDVTGLTTAQKVARTFGIEYNNTIKGPYDPQSFFRKFMGSSDKKPLFGRQKDIAEAVEIIKQQKMFTEASMGRTENAYWFNSADNKKVQVPDHTIHYLLVKRDPKQFGLTSEEVNELTDEGVFKLMGDKGWVRCNVQQNYISVSGSISNEPAVRKAINNALKTEIFERAHIDLYGAKRDITGSYVETYIALKNPEQIKAYVKHGTKPNSLHESKQITAKQILTIINEPQVQKHRKIATTGDCGTFALAFGEILKKRFNITSELGILIDDETLKDNVAPNELANFEVDWMHVFVCIPSLNNECFDVTGKITSDKLDAYRTYYRKHGNLVFVPNTPAYATAIRSNTDYSNDIAFYKDLLNNSTKNINEAAAVYASSLPQVYKDLPKLGKGMTSIVLDKGDGNVLMFTRDAVKAEWLTRPWGIEIGKTIEVLDGMPHKMMQVRDMPVFVIEMPKLHKLDAKNKAIIKKEIDKWHAIASTNQSYNKDQQMNKRIVAFQDHFPDSILIPIIEFMGNYGGNANMDVAIRNTMQDEKGNIVFVDPIVSDELLGYLRGYRK